MKKIILILFCLQAVFAFSQNYDNPQPTITGYNIYGYVNGIRLDSLPAIYATFGWRGDSYTFDYGQVWTKRKGMMITDDKGSPLIVGNYNLPFAFNFFYYNGWELDKAYSVSNESDFILKKRNR